MTRVILPGCGPVDEHTDLWALFVDDARGVWGLAPGELWSELVEAAPDLRERVIDVLVRGLESDEPQQRNHALRAMEHVTDARVLRALRVAFERDPARFVGVSAGDARFPTLLGAWTSAVAFNQSEDLAEAKRAVSVARPYLTSREVDPAIFSTLRAVDPEAMLDDLPSLVSALPEDRVRRLVQNIDVERLPEAAQRLRTAPKDVQDAFVKAVWHVLAPDRFGQYAAWESVMAALGRSPATRLPH